MIPPPAWRRIRALLLLFLAIAASLGGVAAYSLHPRWPAPLWAEIARSGVAAVPLGALLVALGGFAGAAVLARAQAGGDARRIGRAARLGQAIAVPLFALAGAAVAWRLRPLAGMVLAPAGMDYALGAGAIGLAFPLLIAERQLAAIPARVLPDAPGLRALALLATLTCFLSGLLELAAGFGLAFTDRAASLLALLVAATGCEIAARALGRLFLPPPLPDQARAACRSVIALALVAGAREKGFAAPIRAHLGIDFSRSWALAYVRASALPMALCLGLLAWGLSGVVVVPLDQRMIYQRFGAPVSVLHPGLHAILPWPLGTTRRLEFGAVHEIGLVGGAAESALPDGASAEDLAPARADRLWESPHPGEITLAIASRSGARQSFQSVSADLRLLYRVGMSDAAGLAAAYGSADPVALMQAVSGRVVAAYYADRTLDEVLGARSEATADELRAAIQAELNSDGSGLDLVAVVIEAIHPPAGAADAYHYVRAAEIAARASIASERGNAIVIRSQSSQYANAQVAAARATAAETVGAARTALIRFTADRDAARAGGRAFLLERYFTDLSGALGRSPMMIIDHRLNWPEAPVLDLRPLAAAQPIGEKGE